MDRRALIAIALSFVVLFGSNWLFQKLGWLPSSRTPNVATQPSGTSSTPGEAELGAGKTTSPVGGTSTAPASPALGGTAGAWIAPNEALADTVLTIEQPLYIARFQPKGARLLSVVLKDYKDSGEGRATLAGVPSTALDLGTDAQPVSLAGVPYAWAESLDAGGRIAKLEFTAHDSAGMAITQTYRFGGDDYKIGYSVEIEGVPPALRVEQYRVGLRSWPLETERTRTEDLNNLGVTSKAGKDNKRHLTNDLRKGPRVDTGAIRWVAVHSKYFLLGLIGENVEGIETKASLTPETDPEKHDQVAASLTVPLPAPGRTHRYTIYAGPLDYWHVQRLGMDLEPPHAFAFNFFKPFSSALAWLLAMFHKLIHNWGVAIILLSTLAKAATHPLQARGMKSMRAMQKIQPEVERLKKKYEKDPQKMNEAMMALYKENNINPLSGCLPMVIQMPFFLALYHVLGYSIGLRQAGFVGWIQDLSAPDLLFSVGSFPVRVLPVLMYGSMVLQMRMSPTDPKQAMTMNLMNFVFLFLFYNLPSGLVLYWTVINLLTALQSWLISRSDPQPKALAA